MDEIILAGREWADDSVREVIKERDTILLMLDECRVHLSREDVEAILGQFDVAGDGRPMKYFDHGKTQNGYGEPGLCFEDIFSMVRAGDQIIFWEECDGYHSQTLSIPEAIELFKEAIGWLEGGAIDEG